MKVGTPSTHWSATLCHQCETPKASGGGEQFSVTGRCPPCFPKYWGGIETAEGCHLMSQESPEPTVRISYCSSGGRKAHTWSFFPLHDAGFVFQTRRDSPPPPDPPPAECPPPPHVNRGLCGWAAITTAQVLAEDLGWIRPTTLELYEKLCFTLDIPILRHLPQRIQMSKCLHKIN